MRNGVEMNNNTRARKPREKTKEREKKERARTEGITGPLLTNLIQLSTATATDDRTSVYVCVSRSVCKREQARTRDNQLKKHNFFCLNGMLERGFKHGAARKKTLYSSAASQRPSRKSPVNKSSMGGLAGRTAHWSAWSAGSSPSPCVSDVHNVRLSRRSCIIRVLSL